MFCPKCGNTLPDDAAFCGSCGNKLEGRPGIPASSNAQPTLAGNVIGGASNAAPGISLGGLSLPGTQIISIAFAVLAIIFALMPWFLTSNNLIYAGRLGSQASNYYLDSMYNYSAAAFSDSYTVFGLNDFASDLARYLSGSYKGSIQINVMIGVWIAGMLLVAAGSIVSVLKNNGVLLIVGDAVLMLFALFYALFYYGSFASSDYAESCINPYICAVACLVSLVLAGVTIANNKKSAKVAK